MRLFIPEKKFEAKRLNWMSDPFFAYVISAVAFRTPMIGSSDSAMQVSDILIPQKCPPSLETSISLRKKIVEIGIKIYHTVKTNPCFRYEGKTG